eukprot:6095220-Prymnesium_polylepis.2
MHKDNARVLQQVLKHIHHANGRRSVRWGGPEEIRMCPTITEGWACGRWRDERHVRSFRNLSRSR